MCIRPTWRVCGEYMSVLKCECIHPTWGRICIMCVSYLRVVPEWYVHMCVHTHTTTMLDAHIHITLHVGHMYTNTYHPLGITYIAPSM